MKRRLRRKQQAVFEEAARLARPKGCGIVMPRRCNVAAALRVARRKTQRNFFEDGALPRLRLLLLQRGEQRVDAVSLLPRYAEVLATHVAISGELAVDGAAQIEVADDGCRAQVEDLLDGLFELTVIDLAGAERLNEHAHGMRNADGVGKLHLALFSKTGSHDVLSDIARGVSGTAVDLRRSLPENAPPPCGALPP